jgi:hypothetical protein
VPWVDFALNILMEGSLVENNWALVVKNVLKQVSYGYFAASQ